jgi:hypothetical protein
VEVCAGVPHHSHDLFRPWRDGWVAPALAVRGGDGAPVELRVRAPTTALRVEVANSGAAFNPAGLPASSTQRGGGWGLRIVDVVTHRWGVEIEDAGVRVWFEIDRPQNDAALPLTDEAPTAVLMSR